LLLTSFYSVDCCLLFAFLFIAAVLSFPFLASLSVGSLIDCTVCTVVVLVGIACLLQ
jgi:hypothetical protein